MWARPPTWCSRAYLECGAGHGACAGGNEPWFALELGRVPHGEEATVLVVVPQAAQGGDVELQSGSDGDLQAEPGCADGPQDVAVGKGDDPTACGLAQADEFKGALVDLRRGFSSRAAVPVELPARPLGVDFLGGDALVLTVVELAQKRGQPRMLEAGDLGGVNRALQRAGEDRIEGHSAQARLQGSSLGFALWRQWQIRAACVLATERPFRLAVTDEVDVERQAGLPIISGRPERRDRLALSMTAPARTRWPGRMQTRPTAA